MRNIKSILAALVIAAASFGTAHAGLDLNEVGAFLVYPGVEADADRAESENVETFLTITNTSSNSIIAHVSFINGDQSSTRYCYECDFDVPMSGLDTETLVLTSSYGVTHIINLDSGATRSCAQEVGFVTVDVEDSNHNVLTDNILLGSEVVVDYSSGSAYSVPAISVQGEAGNGDRYFAFDGNEYRKFPSVLGADFIASDFGSYGRKDTDLILFTLAFDRQFPPLTDCSIIGFDAFESQFSNSFQFGCWTDIDPVDIDPEFGYPFLGDAFDYQEHGWLQLSCTVYGTGTNGVVQGGVHGAIVQNVFEGDQLRHPNGPTMANAASWSRILFQSGTVGDAMTLHTENPARGGRF